MKRTYIGHSDSLGRIAFIDEWDDPDAPFCSVCGKDPARGCPHVGTPEYGRQAQVFFGRPDESGLRALREKQG